MRRVRSAKIVATLGPATSDEKLVRALFQCGVDVFRLNFSHGTHADHARRLEIVRAVERELGRPIGVLLDLQGPKLRLGAFDGGKVQLEAGARLRLDLDDARGNARRAPLPP
jgi:pyruvate kinase